MYTGQDFDPCDTSESLVWAFDFVNDFQTGEFVTTIVNWSLTVSPLSLQTDPNPSARLTNPPFIITPTTTGVPTIAAQRLTNLVPSVRYIAQAVVFTNLSNNKSLYSHIYCEDVI